MRIPPTQPLRHDRDVDDLADELRLWEHNEYLHCLDQRNSRGTTTGAVRTCPRPAPVESRRIQAQVHCGYPSLRHSQDCKQSVDELDLRHHQDLEQEELQELERHLQDEAQPMSARRCTHHHRRTPVHPNGSPRSACRHCSGTRLWTPTRESDPRGAVEPCPG